MQHATDGAVWALRLQPSGVTFGTADFAMIVPASTSRPDTYARRGRGQLGMFTDGVEHAEAVEATLDSLG